jgi:hypothetical protein
MTTWLLGMLSMNLVSNQAEETSWIIFEHSELEPVMSNRYSLPKKNSGLSGRVRRERAEVIGLLDPEAAASAGPGYL